jgi:hypothetical protein
MLEVAIENIDVAPIEILEYKSSLVYRRSGFASWRNWVKVHNRGDRRIVRYDIEFVLYNVYGEETRRFNGFSKEPLQGAKNTTCMWTDDYIRKGSDKAVARISRLAFDNGKVWEPPSK